LRSKVWQTTPEIITANYFNIHFPEVHQLCFQGKYKEAKEYIECLPQKTSYVAKLRLVYKDLFIQLYNQYGVVYRYENDPYYQYIVPSLELKTAPDHELNTLFWYRDQIYNSLLKQFNHEVASAQESAFFYHLIDLMMHKEYTLMNLIDYCSKQLTRDYSSEKFYFKFFNDKGVLWLIDDKQALLEGIEIPNCIHTAQHWQEKMLLNKLIEYANQAKEKDVIARAVKYIIASCQNSHDAPRYRLLVQEIIDGLVDYNNDLTFLSCGDFSIDERLAQLVAEVINYKNTLDAQNPLYKKIMESIASFDYVRYLIENKKHEIAHKFLKSIFNKIDLPHSELWQNERKALFSETLINSSESTFKFPDAQTAIKIATIGGGVLATGGLAYVVHEKMNEESEN